jgi:hypothetical protein
MKKTASVGYALIYCLAYASPLFMPSVVSAIWLYQKASAACHNILNTLFSSHRTQTDTLLNYSGNQANKKDTYIRVGTRPDQTV